MRRLLPQLLCLLLALSLSAQVPQIAIPRVEAMPAMPAPYQMRDWQEVAMQYDSFVYDLSKTGQYLPFVFIRPSGVNYPQRPTFGLTTYVGSQNPLATEAINVLPSLVGATLVGIDKSDQHGRNWVLMSQDYFNRANGEGIYLNNFSGKSGGDWWYDLMPNIYFYQLYDLYPPFGDAEAQFISVADRFLEAVRGMGGQAAPWTPAYMNYRAWDFLAGEPNPGGVPEPEAAGAYAWVLYHAYRETGNEAYLQGAEWSVEFLDEWTSNPSYELQLPYGVYTAAKMNAELGTDYDVEKMLNWTFERGPLRGWGAIVGKWGGLDVSGLIGEANDNGNDYAFLMNGLQQAGALAPMVRYDKRFARAIGRWLLNVANASRLFYPGFLPSTQQDAAAWSEQYDPGRVIGYEALRERWEGKTPFATGDALRSGWAATNLALYGASSVGYLGGILSKTNVDKILQVDLLKTDFYRDSAYATYLYYNPYSSAKEVWLRVGSEPVDVYDALTESFLARGARDSVLVSIPADGARVVSLTPPNGNVTFKENRMLIEGVVVDYFQTTTAFTYAPRIQALAMGDTAVAINQTVQVYATVFDQDSETITYEWSTTGGALTGTGEQVQWTAPAETGPHVITLIATDETGQSDTATLQLNVLPRINSAPRIIALRSSTAYTAPNTTVALTAEAADADGDSLTFEWTADAGQIRGTGGEVQWSAPAEEGVYTIRVTVRDSSGASASAQTLVLVKAEAAPDTGQLLAYYPFSGHALDVSGNDLHGTAAGARLTADLLGRPNQAYFFDGIDDRISVANTARLNVKNAITVSLWFRADALPDREIFLVSHGSWQNRWKLSITPERRLRWTVNTDNNGIRDLDAPLPLQLDSAYHVAASFDGTLMLLYLNGEPIAYVNQAGTIRNSPVDLLIGQMLPGDAAYNFRGLIDEVRLHDYALSPVQVRELYESGLATPVAEPGRNHILIHIFPNPADERLQVRLSEPLRADGAWTLLDSRGRVVVRYAAKAGEQDFTWPVSRLATGIYLLQLASPEGQAVVRWVKH